MMVKVMQSNCNGWGEMLYIGFIHSNFQEEVSA